MERVSFFSQQKNFEKYFGGMKLFFEVTGLTNENKEIPGDLCRRKAFTKEEYMGQKKEEIIHRTLVEGYGKYYRLAYSYVHNEADAMDIVQEGAYKAILHSDSLKREEYADTWIYRIMIREAMNFLKKNSRYTFWEENEEGKDDVYDNMDLRTAVDKLPVQDKTVIVLRFFEDMKLEQIAKVTDENVNTVKSRMYRALKKLRVSLAEV